MEAQDYQQDNPPQSLHEDQAVYDNSKNDALDEARLREAINRTDTEKFKLFTRMMRINMMMKNAKITHK